MIRKFINYLKDCDVNFHNLYLGPRKYGQEVAESAVEIKTDKGRQLDKNHINIVNKYVVDSNAPKSSLREAILGYRDYLVGLGEDITPSQQQALNKVNIYIDRNEGKFGNNKDEK